MNLVFMGESLALQKNDGQFGIDTLKMVSLSLAKVWPELHKRIKKGNFNFWDVLFTGVDIAKAGAQIAMNFRDLENEVKDLSEDEAKALAAFLVQNLGISNEKAEIFVSRILLSTITLIYVGIETYDAVGDFLEK